jgi:ABC-type Fe3+/spermidine/putrescine transport system ATPase subunit
LQSFKLVGSETVVWAASDNQVDNGGAAKLCIRPEAIFIQGISDPVVAGPNALSGTVSKVVNLGASVELWVTVGAAHTFKSTVRSELAGTFAKGSVVTLAFEPNRVTVLDTSAS